MQTRRTPIALAAGAVVIAVIVAASSGNAAISRDPHASGTATGEQTPGPGLHDRVAAYLRAHEADLIAFRRDLHRHPELSRSEVRTARVVAERLRALGLAVRTGVGGHGVVGMLQGGRPGPLVAYRADMDAVPSADADPVEFRSTVPGVRHICGHDVHVAIAIGLAGALADVRADLPGSVMFVFQPAEERATGAQAMVDAGLFAGAMPAAIVGLHTAPLEVGRLGVKSGVMMAARDRLRVSLGGTGDLDAAAARARSALESVSTLRPDQLFTPAPEGFAFVRLGPITTRGETRVFGGQVTVAGEARRAQVRGAIASALSALSTSGVRVDHEYLPGADAAGVTNDPALTSRTVEAIRGVLGDVVTTLTTIPPAFSEDFGVFQARVPGTFFFLGVSNASKGIVGMPHSPGYVADEAAIVFGVRAMAAAVIGPAPSTTRR